MRDLSCSRFLPPGCRLEFDAAMPVIGSMSRDASGGPQDYEAAVHWFKIAADGESILSNARLRLRKCWGIDQDISKALLWYRSSAELDHAPAMWNLGRVFDNGIGVEANEASAFDWYGEAAKRGHGSDRCFGRLLSGTVVLKRFGSARLLTMLSKEETQKLCRLAEIYLAGEIVKKDLICCFFYRKAAEGIRLPSSA